MAGAGMGPAGCGAGQSAVLPEPPGRALLREVLRPERVVLYHIPGADRDPWGLRRMVRRQLERSRDEPYHLSALWESLDRMTVTGRGE